MRRAEGDASRAPSTRDQLAIAGNRRVVSAGLVQQSGQIEHRFTILGVAIDPCLEDGDRGSQLAAACAQVGAVADLLSRAWLPHGAGARRRAQRCTLADAPDRVCLREAAVSVARWPDLVRTTNDEGLIAGIGRGK